jgi:hypothetical protein
VLKTFVDYQGWQIRLTDERWQHITQHPEMADMESIIAEALSQPELVKRSRTDGTVQLYYRYRENTVVGNKWLCVVVKYLPADAFIITAYLTDKPKQGEQVWPKP